MAGHSQFKNIMHRKGAQDAKRAKRFTKLLREVTVAAKTAGPDPDTNPRLRNALFQCRSSNVPKDTIDRAISKASETAEHYDSLYYEGRGPGNTALIIHVLTDNKNRSACDVRTALSKHGGSLADVGFLFDHYGVIEYADQDPMALMEYALDHGALDIQERDHGQTQIQRIICGRDQFLTLREALEEKFKQPLKASLSWQAKMPHPLDPDQQISIMKLIHALEDLDDVQSVWTNADDDLALMVDPEEEE
jgi:YebC/PmpR family DNA-binding regulatory protein